MKKVSIIIYILFVGFVMVLALLWPTKPETVIVTHIDTIKGDSIPYVVEIKKPVPIYIDTGSTRWRDRPVDTLAILKDYFARVIYIDTLKNDTSALVVVEDTVTQNRLQGRRLIFANRRPVAVIHSTTVNYPDKKLKLYLGGTVMTSAEYNEIGVGAKLQKGSWLFGYEYGTLHNSHSVGVYYTLFSK